MALWHTHLSDNKRQSIQNCNQMAYLTHCRLLALYCLRHRQILNQRNGLFISKNKPLTNPMILLCLVTGQTFGNTTRDTFNCNVSTIDVIIQYTSVKLIQICSSYVKSLLALHCKIQRLGYYATHNNKTETSC